MRRASYHTAPHHATASLYNSNCLSKFGSFLFSFFLCPLIYYSLARSLPQFLAPFDFMQPLNKIFRVFFNSHFNFPIQKRNLTSSQKKKNRAKYICTLKAATTKTQTMEWELSLCRRELCVCVGVTTIARLLTCHNCTHFSHINHVIINGFGPFSVKQQQSRIFLLYLYDIAIYFYFFLLFCMYCALYIVQ